MPIPGRPELAMQFLWHAHRVRNPPSELDSVKHEPRELTEAEQQVETAALQVLHDYFRCVADFGDDPRKLSTEQKEKAEALRKAEEEAAALRKELAELKAASAR